MPWNPLRIFSTGFWQGNEKTCSHYTEWKFLKAIEDICRSSFCLFICYKDLCVIWNCKWDNTEFCTIKFTVCGHKQILNFICISCKDKTAKILCAFLNLLIYRDCIYCCRLEFKNAFKFCRRKKENRSWKYERMFV